MYVCVCVYVCACVGECVFAVSNLVGLLLINMIPTALILRKLDIQNRSISLRTYEKLNQRSTNHVLPMYQFHIS